MVVGVCRLELLIYDCQSLKSKRQVLRKFKDNISNRFNVSIAEVGAQDLWQRSVIGIAVAGSDKKIVNAMLNKVMDYSANISAFEIIDETIELINY
ncbi:MAG: DUF503 domain-containing protein [Deltaproteobacteria bacterium]|nr:DUF503 domain-containing protein [Deltaproteobacteria bacterium]